MQLQFTWLRAVCAYIVLMFPLGALATTIGTTQGTTQISADDTWTLDNSPYLIQGDVTVTAKLTIEPGVRIEFNGPYTLNIAATGVLIARGTQKDNIVFTSSDGTVVPASLKFTGSIGADAVDAVFDGGGAYLSGSILENVVVEKIGSMDALAPGAVVLNGAHPYIHNSAFRNNGASGIYAYSIDGDLRIENSVIEFNNSTLGGGLFIAAMTGGSLSLQGNTVSANAASQFGGGMYLTGQGNAMTMSGNTFRANNAGLKGGGLYTDKVVVTMTGETVRDNIAGLQKGGGMFLQDSNATVTNSLILRNRSATPGGGIFLQGGTQGGTYVIRDSVLALNESETAHGGGIDMHGDPTVTIDRSVVAGNKARDYGAGVSMTEGKCDVTNSAIVANESANAIGVFKKTTLQVNTIAYNSAGSLSQFLAGTIAFKPYEVSPGVLDPDAKLVIADNNIFRNATPYDVVTFYDGVINAQKNWWGTEDAAAIGGRMALVPAGTLVTPTVDFNARLPEPNTDAPISPPSSVTAIPTATSIKLQWNANPERDTAGYKVYWGGQPFPDYEHVIDVGNATSYEIQNLTSKEIQDLIGGNGFIAVTAYDADYLATNDAAATPVNENQTQGHESWYTLPSATIAIAAIPAKHQKYGDLVTFRITLTNTGPSVGNNEFTVTHKISSGLSYYYIKDQDGIPRISLPSIKAVLSCSPSAADEVTCTHAPIPANASVDIMIPTLVSTADRADAVSTATVRPFNSADAAYNEAQVTLHVNAPDAAVAWSSAPAAKVGDSVNYRLTVKNNGPVAASGTGLDVMIPANFTLDAALDSRCALATDGSPRVTCNLGILNSKAEVSFEFKLTSAAPGEAVLLAQVVTTGDSDMADNQASLTTTIASPVQVNLDPDTGGTPPPASKKGGGVFDPAWLLLLTSLLALRRRANYFPAV